ncbi:MAG TPA: hypothetical protein VMS17_13445 [Gemmataceae bacterium]|nr:hypothetical protein [Gemmataceae bacterium]
MVRNWVSEIRKSLFWSCAALTAAAGVSRAQAPLPVGAPAAPAAAPAAPQGDLRAQVEAQQKKIEELENLIRSGQLQPAGAVADPSDPNAPPKPLTDADVKKIVEGYLKEHPGAGVPSGVSTGVSVGKGFYIRSTPDPKWDNWDDQSPIPFELRIRGRVQLDYYDYNPTDSLNHLTGYYKTATGGNSLAKTNVLTSPTFSQEEVKRLRLIWEGTVFDPNLRYHFEIDGNTRGLTAAAGGGVPGGNGIDNSGGVPGVPDGTSAATVDHAVRLFSAYVAYDFHPCGFEKGCGEDCPDGYYRYTPTVTGIAGKLKPMIAFEEYMSSANEQFVEYGMSNWFFDADDDNLLMGAGTQIKAMDDRLYIQALVTNGNESQFANLQMDDLPGFNVGGWYDFGGTWNDARKRWDLYGDSISDIDYSCNPVLRVGGAANIVPMDRKTEYDIDELSRIRTASAAPGGTSLIGLLGGGGLGAIGTTGASAYSLDAVDSYTFEAYWAAKFHGFSIYNGYWARDLDNFRGVRQATGLGTSAYPGNGLNNPILYTVNTSPTATMAALFPSNKALIDYGAQLQAGYFILPKKLEVCGRISVITGDSGDIYGNGLAGAKTETIVDGTGSHTVLVIPGAFSHNHTSEEYAAGVNYYFYRQLVKWQTDVSWYNGGNPAAGGQSPAGFIPGVDGWMLRTQIQLAF